MKKLKLLESYVNVDDALRLGSVMVAKFSDALPGGFYKPLKKEVITMELLKKSVKVGKTNMYDMEKLYGRLLVISQKRDVQLK